MDKRCPRQLTTFPDKECSLGKNSVTHPNLPEHKKCEWFINDHKSHYCFWVWMDNNRGNPQSLGEIAELTSSNISTVNMILNNALIKLKKKFPNLINLFLKEKDNE